MRGADRKGGSPARRSSGRSSVSLYDDERRTKTCSTDLMASSRLLATARATGRGVVDSPRGLESGPIASATKFPASSRYTSTPNVSSPTSSSISAMLRRVAASGGGLSPPRPVRGRRPCRLAAPESPGRSAWLNIPMAMSFVNGWGRSGTELAARGLVHLAAHDGKQPTGAGRYALLHNLHRNDATPHGLGLRTTSGFR